MAGNDYHCVRLIVHALGAAFLMLGSGGTASADVPPEQRPEVAHLFSFVRYSDWEMIRNGTAHSGQEGYRHVLDKYDYFRDRVHSTEDFIDLAASRSLLRGKRYQVDCPTHESQYAGDWLCHELARYRACLKQGGNCNRINERIHCRR